MQRSTQDIQINIPLFGSPSPGGQFVHSLQVTILTDDNGVALSSQHSTVPLIADDFTPELLAALNAKLADVGLVVSKL